MRLRKFSSKRNRKLILLMQTEPGSIPGSGEALAKFSRNYAELYWEFNEPISRPLGGQEVPRNGGLMCPFILYTQKSTIESYTEKVRLRNFLK